MKQRFLLLLEIILISCLSGCGLFNKYDKTVSLKHAGSVLFWDIDGNYYTLEGQDYKYTTNEGYAYIPEYYYSKNGKEVFKLKNKKKVLDDITLTSVNDYNNEIYKINLDDVQNNYMMIQSYMNNIEIYSSNPNIVRNFAIGVEKRTTPLTIKFTNVNIQPTEWVPAFFNFNDVDINFYFEGTNTIHAGVCDVDYGDVGYYEEIFYYLKGEIEEEINTIIPVQFRYHELLMEFIELNKKLIDQSDSFFSYFMTIQNDIFKLADKGLEFFDNVLNGQGGYRGFDGCSCISTVSGLSFLGKGSVSIYGGTGGNGSNATESLLGKNYGGNGGNGGTGVLADSIALINDKATIYGGNGGVGGKGHGGIIDAPSDYDGKYGDLGEDIQCRYYFSKIL